jgi:hypothetical protein
MHSIRINVLPISNDTHGDCCDHQKQTRNFFNELNLFHSAGRIRRQKGGPDILGEIDLWILGFIKPRLPPSPFNRPQKATMPFHGHNPIFGSSWSREQFRKFPRR